MTLTCIHCKSTISTLIIGDNESALADISTKFLNHLSTSHPHTIAKIINHEIPTLTGLALWLIALAKHSTLLDLEPDESIRNPVMEHFSEVIEQVEDILGVEVYDTKAKEDELCNQYEYIEGCELTIPMENWEEYELIKLEKEGKIRKKETRGKFTMIPTMQIGKPMAP